MAPYILAQSWQWTSSFYVKHAAEQLGVPIEIRTHDFGFDGRGGGLCEFFKSLFLPFANRAARDFHAHEALPFFGKRPVDEKSRGVRVGRPFGEHQRFGIGDDRIEKDQTERCASFNQHQNPV